MAPSDPRRVGEAWLRGPLPDVDPFLMPAAHSLVQCREDIAHAIEGLTPEQLRARPGGAASIAFHLAHIAGATDRLLTYARGEALSESQRAAAALEKEDAPGRDAASLLAGVSSAMETALAQLRATPRDTLLDARPVGRAGLPTNVLGLLAHAAEHALRHAGQVITTAKVLRGQSPPA